MTMNANLLKALLRLRQMNWEKIVDITLTDSFNKTCNSHYYCQINSYSISLKESARRQKTIIFLAPQPETRVVCGYLML